MEASLNSSCNQPDLVTGFWLYVVVYSLCVPIFLFVFYVGFGKWKRRGAGSFSHSDVFTFHIVLMEMLGLVGAVVFACGLDQGLLSPPGKAGVSLMHVNSFGQGFLQCLTCVDRYLAVVFPVTYLRLRKGSGVTMRNTSLALVWTACIGRLAVLSVMDDFDEHISSFIVSLSTVAVVTFCCVSVLCVLIRPKPGESTADVKRVDQSKRRAFNTMAVILSTLLMKFVSGVEYYTIHFMVGVAVINKCLLFLVVVWFGLPNSLVLPLLFLYRAGTLKALRQKLASKIAAVKNI